ncbi:MAG TPA: glycosyltransferase [Candidatus Saccharimonadales bacterium]|nr:glycosyltransferase [Candidatus Saccharimonadales bacterium]
MDIGGIIFYLFAVVSTVYVVHLGVYLTGANFYDIWQFRRQRTKQGYPSTAKLPLVTVAISAHNEEKVITRCLESIRHSTYPHVQTLVADDGSKDATYKIVRRYIRHHPRQNIHLEAMPKNMGKGRALNFILTRFAKGDLVMTLDADSILAPDAIANAVSYFNDPTIAGVAANVQIIEEPSVLGVLQKFEHMIGYRSKKTYSLINCEFVIGGVASTYRMDILRKVGFYDTDTVTEDIGLSMKIVNQGNRAHRIVYAVDVRAMTEGVDRFRALVKQRYRWKYGSLQNIIKYYHLIGNNNADFTLTLTFYRMPMAVLSEIALLAAPLIWGYTIYVTLSQHSLALVIGAYLTITVYTMITLWWDEHAGFKDRLRLSLFVPVAYFVFYIMDFVQLIAILRCLAKMHQLLTRKDVGGTWASPRRIGREVRAG